MRPTSDLVIKVGENGNELVKILDRILVVAISVRLKLSLFKPSKTW